MTHTEDDRLSFADLLNSLTGFEEDAIEERFHAPISDFLVMDPIGESVARILPKAYRALLFISARRGGEKDADAYKSAMSLAMSEVNDRFFGDDDGAEVPETPLADGASPLA